MSARTWHMTRDLTTTQYRNGVMEFLQAAVNYRRADGLIRCPCRDCLNSSWQSIQIIEYHLLTRGMAWTYSPWIFHGEDVDEDEGNDNIIVDEGINPPEFANFETEADQELLEDLAANMSDAEGDDVDSEGESTAFDGERWTTMFEKARSPVYSGCTKFSLLSAVLQMINLKVDGKQSVKSFNNWLALIKSMLPADNLLPSTYYEARQMLKQLGMDANTIHACKNDCVLFRKELHNLDNCPVCGEGRWKLHSRKQKTIPVKVLRHFPLIPRLQRLFMCRKTASEMRWHKENYVSTEGILRHPVDSEQWKGLDGRHPWFASDPRSVRLGLATDGFNPYANMNTTYSVWPVVMFVYNVPPWRCMKEPYMMMSLLIPGPKSPGKDIDVYLQPLIEELEELWVSGVKTLDVVAGRIFRMHAALLWTINDFPAYGDISGWTTKGYKACPICNVDCTSRHSNNKIHYMGHRRFLPPRHRWRRDGASFDGTVETRAPPKDLVGVDIVNQLSQYEHVVLGKMQERLGFRRNEDGTNWCKKSILFRLPYWQELHIRHNLDVMHIEKNICDNLVGTIFGLKGKSKDTDKARLTLQEMGIRPELHLQERSGRIFKPPAAYTLSTRQMREVCNSIRNVKMPNGYASNISSCLGADEVSLRGLKSHDCHVLLQRILPVVIRGVLEK